jgi:tRNA G18 (ribose-2'-O)-methylase SpoU
MSKKFNRVSETKIYGENACLALFKNRPEDIIQLFLTKEKLNTFAALTKYCVQHKKAYHLVTREELDVMTKATHHEDICLLIKKKETRTLAQYLQTKPLQSLLIALENVSNPHNVGAILRSAAHFGANGIVVPGTLSALAAAAVRTSEGGNEYVDTFSAPDFNVALALLKKNGFQIITTSSHAKKNLYELKWSPKVVIVFGEEAEGLTKATLSLGESIKIPGTDHIESLNVSVATGIILSEYYRSKNFGIKDIK